ncbi:MAG: 8-oxo-dGTP diphosphatase [Spirochaetota bacterium]
MQTHEQFDWSTFVPQERAVVALPRSNGRLLLIHKKRGLGAGKINGPGGRIEPGETATEAAVRETEEEVGIRIHDPRERATLHFAFEDGYRLTVYVFVSEVFEGNPVETDEALPFWAPVDEIPYESMWADDEHWLPLVLAGHYVEGRFTFRGDSMLSSRLEVRAS